MSRVWKLRRANKGDDSILATYSTNAVKQDEAEIGRTVQGKCSDVPQLKEEDSNAGWANTSNAQAVPPEVVTYNSAIFEVGADVAEMRAYPLFRSL